MSLLRIIVPDAVATAEPPDRSPTMKRVPDQPAQNCTKRRRYRYCGGLQSWCAAGALIGTIMPILSTDLHMHSTYSLDGNDTIAELCAQAVDLGLTHIAVTDHVEWPPDGHHQRPDFDRYFDEIAGCPRALCRPGADRAQRAGAGQPARAPRRDGGPAGPLRLRRRHRLHALAGRREHPLHALLSTGRIRTPSTAATSRRWPTWRARCRATSSPTSTASSGRVRSALARRTSRRMEGPVRDALSAMAENGRVLELNTRFLTHEPSWNDSLLTVLRWYREAGGRAVAVNSDAHRVAEVGRNREIGAELVAAAGCVPYRRQDERVPA